jgi:hypothetical protein
VKIVTVMWSIWHSRNRWKHDEEQTDPVFSVKATREALALLEFPWQQVILPGHGWQPPEFIKINIILMVQSTPLRARVVQAGWQGPLADSSGPGASHCSRSQIR